ncbi:unnamed protein product [Arabidopsis arenosa]|uniref:Uncharacterized protein n=1 Tax=Arabidopsis arenosa TaxID=38785 RepID=A0A8S1ZMZ8_ARAAE|nr:unnamed protein product [Arabidopsis arenosa]
MHARAVIRSLGLHIPAVASLLQDYLHDANEDDLGNAEVVAAEAAAPAEVAAAPAIIHVPRWCAEMDVAFDAAVNQLPPDLRRPYQIHAIMVRQFPGLTRNQVRGRKKRVAIDSHE